MEDATCRKLLEEDYDKGYLSLMQNLTDTPGLKPEEFNGILSNYPGFIYVIEKNQRIIATASLVVECNIFAEVGHVENVVVDPIYRGQGLAKRIFDHIRAEHPQMSLDLYCTELVQPLYGKLGFHPQGFVYSKYI